MFPTGLLGFVVWGSEKLFLGVLKKNEISSHLTFLEFYANSEFQIKFLRSVKDRVKFHIYVFFLFSIIIDVVILFYFFNFFIFFGLAKCLPY